MLGNTRQTYGFVAQGLHWIMALLIFALLVLGIYMHELPIDTAAQVEQKVWLYSLHKTLGISSFVIALIRVGWAFVQPRPLPLNSERRFEMLLASIVHWLLYGSIIMMPITGWLHHAATEGFAPIWWPFSQDLAFIPKDPLLAEFFGNAHFIVALLLMFSIFLHVAGAIKHTLIYRDQTLARMVPGKQVTLKEPLAEVGNKNVPKLIAGGVFAVLLAAVIFNHFTSHQNAGFISASNSNANTGWIVDPAKSKLEIEIIQGGKPVAGSFANWQAEIEFDPDKLDAAKVIVNVDIASLTLGSISDRAVSADFLDAAKHPQAVFSSDTFTKLGEDKFEAIGELTLIGQTKPLALPFDLKIENGRAFMTSVAEVQRLDFGLGEKGFKTDGILGFNVKINVTLEAERK